MLSMHTKHLHPYITIIQSLIPLYFLGAKPRHSYLCTHIHVHMLAFGCLCDCIDSTLLSMVIVNWRILDLYLLCELRPIIVPSIGWSFCLLRFNLSSLLCTTPCINPDLDKLWLINTNLTVHLVHVHVHMGNLYCALHARYTKPCIHRSEGSWLYTMKLSMSSQTDQLSP